MESNMATAVAAVADGNIWAGFIPRQIMDDRIFPAVGFFIVAPGVEQNQQNFIRNPRYRFDVWGENKDQILTVADAIISALDHRSGLGFSAVFQGELDVDDPDTRLFHRVLEFIVWGN